MVGSIRISSKLRLVLSGKITAITFCVAVLGMLGCSSNQAEDESSEVVPSEASTGSDAAQGPRGKSTVIQEPRRPNSDERDRGRARGSPGGKTRVLPSGAVIRTPPKPQRFSVAPSNGCDRLPLDRDGRTIMAVVPPTPGLSARHAGEDKVVVKYGIGQAPSRCRPAFLSVSVDGNDDPYPSINRKVMLTDEYRGRVRVAIPDPIDADVARATVGARSGRLSDTVSVLIR